MCITLGGVCKRASFHVLQVQLDLKNRPVLKLSLASLNLNNLNLSFGQAVCSIKSPNFIYILPTPTPLLLFISFLIKPYTFGLSLKLYGYI